MRPELALEVKRSVADRLKDLADVVPQTQFFSQPIQATWRFRVGLDVSGATKARRRRGHPWACMCGRGLPQGLCRRGG